MLEAEVVLEGLIAIEPKWSGTNLSIEVEFDALEVIDLLNRKDSSFVETRVLIKDIILVWNFLNTSLFCHMPTSSLSCSLIGKDVFPNCILLLVYDEEEREYLVHLFLSYIVSFKKSFCSLN